MNPGRAALLLVILAVSRPIPCLAADEAATRLVVELHGVPGAEVLAHLREAFGASFEARVLGVDTFLQQGLGPWLVTEPARYEPCGGQPLPADELAATLVQVEEAMEVLDFGAAQVRLEELEGRLCAATDPLPPEALARIPYLMGILRYYDGDQDAAREAFRLALERQPKMEWDGDFAPEPQQVFLSSVGAALASPRSMLTLPSGDGPAGIWIDGVPVAEGADEVALVGEQHLLQLQSADGALVTVALATNAAPRIELVPGAVLHRGLGGDPTADGAAPAFAALASAATALGYAEVIVYAGPEPLHVWRYNLVEPVWVRLSTVLGKQLSRARGTQVAGLVLIGSGAAAAVVGTVVAIGNGGQARDLRDQMTLPDGQISGGLYALYGEDYEQVRARGNAGAGLALAGCVMAVAGIPLLAHGLKVQRAVGGGSVVEAWPLLGGPVVGIGGKF
ncbi:MAG: hypothetical protein QGH45_07715 [Myxococcota bacterium]|nr:hypothetical protein [Myxococcota bacterium]